VLRVHAVRVEEDVACDAQHRGDADQEGRKAVDRGRQQEQAEVTVVTLGHTGSYPGTVVVMDFYTAVASVAMERPRRS